MPAAFFSAGEQNLQADTDAQERSVLGNELSNRADQTQSPQAGYGISRRADPGQDNSLSLKHLFGGTDYLRQVTQSANGIKHAAQIARSIVNNGNRQTSFPMQFINWRR
jgi:hypothetical protein